MTRENSINNSYQIKEEFRRRPKLYHPPLARKRQRVMAEPEPNGECRCYTEEEIFIYQCQQAAKSLGWC